MTPLQLALEQLYTRQLSSWPLCRQNYSDIASIETRTITVDGADYRLQFNPARIRSARAKVQDGRVDRPCFLCRHLRPVEQEDVPYTDPVSRHAYLLSVNPYPITDHHFTLVSADHVPQRLSDRVGDMARLAESLPDYLVFFNGACSGASAPDHMHFQAVPQRTVPLLTWSPETQARTGVTGAMPEVSDSDLMNVACWSAVEADGTRSLRWLVIDRRCHRPWQYSAAGEEQCLISPATLEFCGLVPLARREDFERMDSALLDDIFRQVRRLEPRLRVGIIEAPAIDYQWGAERRTVTYPAPADLWLWQSPFTLPSVTIGKEFHWQQQESQTFDGVLQLRSVHGRMVAINHVPVETYLRSVIASEMSADNNLELLKAHAVISRSWVLRQIKPAATPHSDAGAQTADDSPKDQTTTPADADRIIRWFDHDDHTDFDVCADDHCQRYQGLTRVRSEVVDQAIAATRGEVLVSDTDGSICDARFSKCCGGMTEAFEVCWQDQPHDYLQPVEDAPEPGAPSFCDTTDPRVLRLVLNSYDRTTSDFYRWTVSYTRAGLSDLVERKMHWGLGEIRHLRPLKRGRSGRIYELEIEGEHRTVVVGKELMIRKALSESHLYSSAFTVEERDDNFILHGAGWGHGVGLCQIGAACMSLRGYTYDRILAHYFPHTHLCRRY